jgi:hypothetical protein
VIVDCKISATSLALSWKPANTMSNAHALPIKAYSVELALIGDAKSGADQKSSPLSVSAAQFADASRLSTQLRAESGSRQNVFGACARVR